MWRFSAKNIFRRIKIFNTIPMVLDPSNPPIVIGLVSTPFQKDSNTIRQVYESFCDAVVKVYVNHDFGYDEIVGNFHQHHCKICKKDD